MKKGFKSESLGIPAKGIVTYDNMYAAVNDKLTPQCTTSSERKECGKYIDAMEKKKKTLLKENFRPHGDMLTAAVDIAGKEHSTYDICGVIENLTDDLKDGKVEKVKVSERLILDSVGLGGISANTTLAKPCARKQDDFPDSLDDLDLDDD